MLFFEALGDDNGLDIELESRIDSVIQKVRVIYPFIDTRQDLMCHSSSKLMNPVNVQNLGREVVFSGTNLKKFDARIQQYVVSSAAGENSAQWPLVKVADIYVEANILKDGLVLVDIPGSMDTFEALQYPNRSNCLNDSDSFQDNFPVLLTVSVRVTSIS